MIITEKRFVEILKGHGLVDQHIDVVWATAGSNITEETVQTIGRILATTIKHDFKTV